MAAQITGSDHRQLGDVRIGPRRAFRRRSTARASFAISVLLGRRWRGGHGGVQKLAKMCRARGGSEGSPEREEKSTRRSSRVPDRRGRRAPRRVLFLPARTSFVAHRLMAATSAAITFARSAEPSRGCMARVDQSPLVALHGDVKDEVRAGVGPQGNMPGRERISQACAIRGLKRGAAGRVGLACTAVNMSGSGASFLQIATCIPTRRRREPRDDVDLRHHRSSWRDARSCRVKRKTPPRGWVGLE